MTDDWTFGGSWPYEPHWHETQTAASITWTSAPERAAGGAGARQPGWGYLYRNFIPPPVDAGYRVIVPDLLGAGRSDKPDQPEV